MVGKAADAPKLDTREAKMRQAYGRASSRLRDAHREEFNDLMAEESRKIDLDWKPRPTEEDKARQRVAAILEKHPELREELASGDQV